MNQLHFAEFLVNSRSDLALHTEHLDIILVVQGLEVYYKSTENSYRPSSKSAQTSYPIVIPHINRLYHKSHKQQAAYRLHTALSKQCTAVSAEQPSVCHFLPSG